MVSEIMVGNNVWESFLCTRPPPQLMDSIMKRRLDFYTALQKLSPKVILDYVPMTYPMTHVALKEMPGVAKFPIDQWERDGRPHFNDASWIALALKACAEDMTNLEDVFKVCNRLKPTQGQIHIAEHTHVSLTIRPSPSSSSHADYMSDDDAPPPPPGPPPPGTPPRGPPPPPPLDP